MPNVMNLGQGEAAVVCIYLILKNYVTIPTISLNECYTGLENVENTAHLRQDGALSVIKRNSWYCYTIFPRLGIQSIKFHFHSINLSGECIKTEAPSLYVITCLGK